MVGAVDDAFIGLGTLINVVAVLAGSAIGVLAGTRLSVRVRDLITDALGLVTLAVAGLNVAAVLDAELLEAVGDGVPILIVLGAVVIGGVAGALLRVEYRLEGIGDWLRRRFKVRGDGDQRTRFVDGYVTASLVFCVGPLTVLGSLQDGLGEGIDLLILKSSLDFFASIAFAASLGWGVAASAVTVGVVQGTLTILGAVLGEVLTDAQVAALTATGGLLLIGVSFRLLRLKQLPVGDLLPALIVAPLLVSLVAALR
jgi:uncharacterized membrane protein YqgA involved in biofilm formation